VIRGLREAVSDGEVQAITYITEGLATDRRLLGPSSVSSPALGKIQHAGHSRRSGIAGLGAELERGLSYVRKHGQAQSKEKVA
jgi:hypothetical protein